MTRPPLRNASLTGKRRSKRPPSSLTANACVWYKINSQVRGGVGGTGVWVLICCYCGKVNERLLHRVAFTTVPSDFPPRRPRRLRCLGKRGGQGDRFRRPSVFRTLLLQESPVYKALFYLFSCFCTSGVNTQDNKADRHPQAGKCIGVYFFPCESKEPLNKNDSLSIVQEFQEKERERFMGCVSQNRSPLFFGNHKDWSACVSELACVLML